MSWGITTTGSHVMTITQRKRPTRGAGKGSHSNLIDVVLWALAQHGDPTVEAIEERWGVDRSNAYRWRTTLADARARWAMMDRSRRPIEVLGRSMVVSESDDGVMA